MEGIGRKMRKEKWERVEREGRKKTPVGGATEAESLILSARKQSLIKKGDDGIQPGVQRGALWPGAE